MAHAQILVIVAGDAIPESLQAALRRTHATANFWPLSEALRAGRLPNTDAVVVVVPDDPSHIAGPLRVLFDRIAEHPRATLILKANGEAVPHLAHPAALPVTFFDGRDDHELCGRLNTMVQMRSSLDCLQQGMLANRRTGESIAKRYVNQLRLASQVQREFLPDSLPRFGPVHFSALFRPVDYVSGDIYDVRRLDEDHVGIALADATGHGMPAALLTVYIKRALRGKEIENGSYRILSPDDVLERLNEDIMDAHLTECPFVAAVYGVFNIRTYELTLARGGAPFPLLRRRDGEVQVITSSGAIVGVLPENRFEVRRIQMQPGDSLIVYSDGLERIVAPDETAHEVPEELRSAARAMEADLSDSSYGMDLSDIGADGGDGLGVATAVATSAPASQHCGEGGGAGGQYPHRGRSMAAGHELITKSSWCRTLRREGPVAALQQAAGRQRTLRRLGYPLDDLTVLCLHIDNN